MMLRTPPRTDLKIPKKPRPPQKVDGSRVRTLQDEKAVEDGYVYSQAHADLVIDWIQTNLQQISGRWAGQPFELAEWQRDQIVEPIFGWVHRETGLRRYNRSYVEIPKKNGKTTLAAAIGLYMLFGDGEDRAEVYSTGSNREQAAICHDTATMMVEESNLKYYCSINRHTGEIKFPQKKSVYRILSNTKRGKHGLSIHCSINDELHEWFGNEMWEALKYGSLARSQPLSFVITNAGDDTQSVCYKQRLKAQRIIDGVEIDHRFLALIYSSDKELAEAEFKSLVEGKTELPVAKNCNPAMGEILSEEVFAQDVQDAANNPVEIPNFMRLRYGCWEEVGALNWLGEEWPKHQKPIEEPDGMCFLGLDLSQIHDLTALVACWNDDGKFYIKPWLWITEAEVQKIKSEVQDILQWVEQGHINVCPGRVMDWREVIDKAIELTEIYDIQGLVYDPKDASYPTDDFTEQTDIERIPFEQSHNSYHEATETFQRVLESGKLSHDGNPVMAWQFLNAILDPNHAGRKKPARRDPHDNRTIDSVQAAVMAFSECYAPEEEWSFA